MKTLARVVALCAVCCSAVSLSGPPAKAEEGSLSCVPAARPFFTRAWESLSNVHLDDARELFAQTVAVDPSCTLAWAHLGALTPGANGRKMVDDAVAASAALPEVERLQVQALAAQHRGDNEQALSLFRSALGYAPNSFALNFAVAQRAGVLRLWAEMVPAALRATELEPERGAGWNLLGYAYVGLKQHPQAVLAFRHYADVAPLEPNAHDSLGDALLANNELDEARAAYQRAIDSSNGTFWASGHGVATVCALQRDWFCARAAIERARRSALLVDDRLRLMEWTAWSYFADAQPGEAFRALDELEQDARRSNLEARWADSKLLRGRFLLNQGRYRDALTSLQGLGLQKFPTLNEGQRSAIEAGRLHGMVEAQARLGNVGDAEKTLTALRTLFEARPREVQGLDAMAHARGLIALQRKDFTQAISAFMQCSEGYDACRLNLAEAQQAAGDPAEAARTRALVSTANHRDPEYWWVHVQAMKSRKGGLTPTDEARPAW
jgi:tetratricopeptide (TPR) repeat protein